MADLLNEETFIKKLDLTALRQAIDENNIEEISRLINKVDPDELDQLIGNEYTYLYKVSSIGQTEIVELLLSAGANPDITDRYSRETPLSVASRNGYIKIVDVLLSIGANPNIANINDQTPLFLASVYGRTEVTEMLLKAGADPNIDSDHNETPLYVACASGHIQIVKLLDFAGANPNIAARYNMTPLYVASQRGEAEIVKFLLSVDADPNIADYDNETPLYAASTQGHTRIVKLLLYADADPNIASNRNKTPYDIALERKHMEIANILKNWKGLDPDIVVDNGRTVLMDLIIEDYYPKFKKILPQVKNINAQDNDDNTALHHALIHRRKEMVRDLLEQSASTDIPNKEGITQINYALEILKMDKDNTYVRELYRAARKFLYGGEYYLEARSHFIDAKSNFTEASNKITEDPLLIDPAEVDDNTLKDLAEAFSLFQEDWDKLELQYKIRKIQAQLRSLPLEYRDVFLEALYMKYIMDNYL